MKKKSKTKSNGRLWHGMVAYTRNPSTWKADTEDRESKVSLG